MKIIGEPRVIEKRSEFKIEHNGRIFLVHEFSNEKETSYEFACTGEGKDTLYYAVLPKVDPDNKDYAYYMYAGNSYFTFKTLEEIDFDKVYALDTYRRIIYSLDGNIIAYRSEPKHYPQPLYIQKQNDRYNKLCEHDEWAPPTVEQLAANHKKLAAKLKKGQQTSPQPAYKLMRLRKNGTLGSLFINRKQIIPVGTWLKAESYPTKGYAMRPGWHVTLDPYAPHLTLKGRVWVAVEVSDFSKIERPKAQGGTWLIANWMRVLAILEPKKENGYATNIHSV